MGRAGRRCHGAFAGACVRRNGSPPPKLVIEIVAVKETGLNHWRETSYSGREGGDQEESHRKKSVACDSLTRVEIPSSLLSIATT